MTWTAEQRRAVNAERIAAGLCVWCAEIVPLFSTTPTHCDACYAKKVASARRWRSTDLGLQRDRDDKAARRAAQIRAGLCAVPACASPPRSGRRMCPAHLNADTARQSARREGTLS